jgi:hypothetical protein
VVKLLNLSLADAALDVVEHLGVHGVRLEMTGVRIGAHTAVVYVLEDTSHTPNLGGGFVSKHKQKVAVSHTTARRSCEKLGTAKNWVQRKIGIAKN